ncbi:MAG: hypothetical protein PHT02_00145 [Tissierellia bacterium]|nr:hypothetical protein [Tissierellia bacterium]
MNVHPSLKVRFNKDFKKVNNSEFVEGTALIAYSGDNRNGSDITEQAFNDAMPSLGLIPLVGHWLSDKQNFGGHDITIEWNGNELVLKDNTIPYGVVKENHNAEWIEIEENGKKHKYIKADVVLWYARYPEPVQKVIDTGVNQSMEINCKSYSEKVNGNIQIDSFEYSALCLLGLDIDENGQKGEDNVEPCFESASVVIDKFTVNDNFKEQFNQLLFALNKNFKIDSYFISENEAEQIVEKANSIFIQLGFECSEYIVDGKEYDVTGIINKTLNKELSEAWGFNIYDKDTITIKTLDFNSMDTASISISSVELLMNKNINTNQQHFTLKIKNNFDQGGESENMNKKEDKNLDNKELSFSATYRQKREALQNALDPVIIKNEEDKIISETYYWLDDFSDTHCMVEKYVWVSGDGNEETYGRFTYSFDETEIKATITSEFEKLIKTALTQEEYDKVMSDRETMSAKFEELKTKTAEFETTISTLETEKEALNTKVSEFESVIVEKDTTISTLQEYKNNIELNLKLEQIDEIIAEFEVILKDNEEFEIIKSKAKDMEIDILEKELYALEGKVKHTKTNKTSKKNHNFSKVSVVDDTNTITDSYYGDAVKYIKK